jgi:enamine deaminase RidA (YjgF/YER057c/UK114 family)
MPGAIETRLSDLDITLPQAPAPVASYVPFVRTGNLVFVAGQIPIAGGDIVYKGACGGDLTVEDGAAAARLCALNIIAQVHAACAGDLDRVIRCVRLGGYVNATPDFVDHPKVLNAASELIVEIFGEAGRHVRIAVGASNLPLGVAVEIDAVFEIS